MRQQYTASVRVAKPGTSAARMEPLRSTTITVCEVKPCAPTCAGSAGGGAGAVPRRHEVISWRRELSVMYTTPCHPGRDPAGWDRGGKGQGSQ